MTTSRKFPWPTDRRDFHGEDFSHYIFEDLQIDTEPGPVSFHRVDFKGAQFIRSRLKGADLSRSDFVDARIDHSTFAACKLDHFGVQSTLLQDSQMIDCDAPSSEFSESRFVRTTIRGGRFTGGTFLNSIFEDCEFSSVGLERTTVENNHFYRTRFSEMDLANQSVLHCTFSACTFDRVTLDVEILSTCTGFTLQDIQSASISRRGRVIEKPLASIIDELYRRHQERDELVEACNVAILAGRQDLFENTLVKLRELIRETQGEVRTLQLVRLARKLLYWNVEERIDPYWIAWVSNTIMDRMRSPNDPLPPDHHVIEALTLLLPAVEQYARASAQSILPTIRGHELLDSVRVELVVDDQWTVADALALVEELNAHASQRVPRVLQMPGGLMKFEYQRARAGSIVIDGTMVIAGLVFLKLFLQQSTGVIDAAGGFFDSVGRAADSWHRMRHGLAGGNQGSTGDSRDADIGVDETMPDDEGSPLPVGRGPPGPPAGGAMVRVASHRAVTAAANEEFIVSVASRLVVPPKTRRVIAKHVLRVDIVADVTGDDHGVPSR